MVKIKQKSNFLQTAGTRYIFHKDILHLLKNFRLFLTSRLS